jgi:DNA repair protein RecO (recombination protein O)
MPRNERTIKAEAIILRHSDWGEADRLLSLFTREHGKLRAVAKGVRKMQSRKAGHLEPFTRVNLVLAKGHDLWIVTQAEAVDDFQPVRENLQLLTQAAYVVELLDRFTYEEGQNWQLYKLVIDTLSRLSKLSDPFIVNRFYEMRLLDVIGFRPMLFECANCRKEIIAEDQFFSAEQGGVLCPSCGARSLNSRLISMDALRYIRHFQRSNFTDSLKADPSLKTRLEIEGLLNYYLTYLLERSLNTPEFLKQIREQPK